LLTWKRRSLGFGAFAAATVLALGAYALSASAVPEPRAGSGTGVSSGYRVSGVAYAAPGDLLTDVSFDLDAPAAQVDVRLGSAGGRWYDCGASAAMSPFTVSCAVSSRIADADVLSVSVR
jgi:hypothetical protein